MTRILRLAALAAFLFPFATSAQPANRADLADRRIERLTERLSLTDAQAAMVREAFSADRGPGDSWALASRLAPTLSASQIEALKQRPERPERGARGDAPRPSGEADTKREGNRAERRAQMDAARDAALGLSDRQKQALADLREQREARRGALPDEMAQILTEEQEAVLLVHRALSPRGAVRGHRGGRGDGPRGEHRDGERRGQGRR